MENPTRRSGGEPSEDAVSSRRRFLGYASGLLGGVIAAALGLPLARFFVGDAFATKSVSWTELAPVEDIALGGPQLFRVSRRDRDGWRQLMRREAVYVVAEGGGSFTVFSSACTHLGCPVHWDDNEQAFLCPCHNGAFSASGAVTEGPPPRPLDKLEHKIEAGALYVRLT